MVRRQITLMGIAALVNCCEIPCIFETSLSNTPCQHILGFIIAGMINTFKEEILRHSCGKVCNKKPLLLWYYNNIGLLFLIDQLKDQYTGLKQVILRKSVQKQLSMVGNGGEAEKVGEESIVKKVCERLSISSERVAHIGPPCWHTLVAGALLSVERPVTLARLGGVCRLGTQQISTTFAQKRKCANLFPFTKDIDTLRNQLIYANHL